MHLPQQGREQRGHLRRRDELAEDRSGPAPAMLASSFVALSRKFLIFSATIRAWPMGLAVAHSAPGRRIQHFIEHRWRSREKPQEAARSRQRPPEAARSRYLAAFCCISRCLAASRGFWRLLAASGGFSRLPPMFNEMRPGALCAGPKPSTTSRSSLQKGFRVLDYTQGFQPYPPRPNRTDRVASA